MNPGGEARGDVVHEPLGAIAVAPADEERNNELRIRVQRGPRPGVASAIGRGLGIRNVLLFGVDERPNLVDLNSLRLHPPDVLVVEGSAELASVLEQLRDRVDAHVRNAGDRPHGRSLAEHVEDLGALGDRQLVHAHKI